MITDYVARDEIKNRTLRSTPIDKLADYEIKAIWPKGRQLSKRARAFLDIAAQTLSWKPGPAKLRARRSHRS